MIQDFDAWSSGRSETNSFSDLSGSVLAIEASFYLDRLLNQPPSKEPLLPALGGLPFSLRVYVQNDLDALSEYGIRPLFVFNGIEAGKKHSPFKDLEDAARLNDNAWELYNRHEAEQAVDSFGKSGCSRPEAFYPILLKILRESGVAFQVAPGSAWGQLAYLAKHCPNHVDAIAGSSELLLFNVEKLIVRLDFGMKEFTFITRQQCIEELGNITPEMFVDACILSGTSMLPSLPTLVNAPPAARRQPKIRQVVDLMKTNGHSGISVCDHFRDDLNIGKLDYVDRYRRSRLAVKHQTVLTVDGKVEPFDADNVPNDAHEVIGQRLPDELYYYLSRGAIGARVLNQLTSGQILEQCPIDGGDSEVYRLLVSEKLSPLRAASLSLLSHSLTRAYQHRNIELYCWYDHQKKNIISIADMSPPKEILSSWNVPDDVVKSNLFMQRGKLPLSSAICSLGDASFAEKTIRTRDRTSGKLLSTKPEIGANAVWRFLHLRGYINQNHTLSTWGEVLNAVYSKLSPESKDAEEATFLAVELLRLGLLSSEEMFPHYSGSPMRGTEIDKSNTLLVARLSSLLQLRHKPIGFTGPLSRHLLGYTSIVSAVRTADRDLLEMSLVTLLLAGDANRDVVSSRDSANPLPDMGLALPLLLPTDCGLGIAMKHYLDELPALGDPESPEFREEVKERGPRNWFPHSEDFRGDLERGFKLWDAVCEGVRVGVANGAVNKEVGMKWDDVDAWVQARR